jgi:hypothetical protein
MKTKIQKRGEPMSLSEIFKEVQETVVVYLTLEGAENLKGSPYIRDGERISCSKIVDDVNPNYLFIEARYYTSESKLPKHAYVALPHAYVRYLAADQPFHKARGKAKD